jgi:hypothetical protein
VPLVVPLYRLESRFWWSVVDSVTCMRGESSAYRFFFSFTGPKAGLLSAL